MTPRIFKWPASRKTTKRPKTNFIAIHCSATPEGKRFDATDIDGWHLKNGWLGIGYQYVILLDGSIEAGRPDEAIGSHIEGHNSEAIGIVYIGGLAADGKTPKDTRTAAQKASLKMLLQHLKAKHPNAIIQGHRDFSPDLNHNGTIEPREWMKACPSFDAKVEYAHL